MATEKNKIIAIMALAAFLFIMPNITLASTTVVSGLYTKTYTFDLSTISYQSCRVSANYQTGDCSYIYACWVILPKGSTDLNQVYQKSCDEVTGQPNAIVNISIVPPIGKQYAVSPFVSKVHFKYNNANSTLTLPYQVFVGNSQTNTVPAYTWYVNDTTMPLRLADDIVTLCPAGQILRGNLCYDSVGICANTLSSNMCTNNVFNAYCLDIPDNVTMSYCDNGDHVLTTAEQSCMVSRCNADSARLCTDRNKDSVCDSVVSLTCVDSYRCPFAGAGNLSIGSNGICDDSDQIYCQTQCTDANLNGVCDSVETAGCYCQLTYSPVCYVSQSTSQRCFVATDCSSGMICNGANVTTSTQGYCANATTYPSQCFANCAGITSGLTGGACMQKVDKIQCYQGTDCLRPSGCPTTTLSIGCINYQCSYTGICQNQCASDADCTALGTVCTGVTSTCDMTNHYCKMNGQCITQPTAPMNIWSLIMSIWTSFITWLKGVLGWQ
jgi:hypothetical protein